ncbi:hypothetical protein ABIA39_000703 [Nocardia sp. GAS34]|jgi:hypothetical protein|uniref:LysR family substrate-binding domain-containing protein n=1 Tax=unclassified Nocardia TaxID=2637762 RepID=UPI003D19A13F
MNRIAPDALRVGYVPGVTVSKWARIWAERYPEDVLELVAVPQAEQEGALRDGRVDMCFVRLPIDREGLHAIPLYRELPVVVVPKDHPIALFEQVGTAELADERMQDATDIDALADTVELVAAVGGAAVMPHSLARLHHRKDLVFRTVIGVPETQIALAWPTEPEREDVEHFIGVVRGRTAQSTRGKRSDGGDSAARGGGRSGGGRAQAGKKSGAGTGTAKSASARGAGNSVAGRAASGKAGRSGAGKPASGKSGRSSAGGKSTGGKGQRRGRR